MNGWTRKRPTVAGRYKIRHAGETHDGSEFGIKTADGEIYCVTEDGECPLVLMERSFATGKKLRALEYLGPLTENQ